MLCGNHLNLTQGNGMEVNYKILRPSKVFHGYPFSLIERIERLSIAFTANGKRQAEISRLPKTREIYSVSVYILPVSHSYGASTKNREIS